MTRQRNETPRSDEITPLRDNVVRVSHRGYYNTRYDVFDCEIYSPWRFAFSANFSDVTTGRTTKRLMMLRMRMANSITIYIYSQVYPHGLKSRAHREKSGRPRIIITISKTTLGESVHKSPPLCWSVVMRPDQMSCFVFYPCRTSIRKEKKLTIIHVFKHDELYTI